MEVETIEHQLSEVNEENARLKQELSAVRRQLQHVTKISQSLIDARAEMQATVAAAGSSAGHDSRKSDKTEKAARKKRKKDDAQSSKKQKVEEVVGLSVGNTTLAEDVSDLHQQQLQNQAAVAHPKPSSSADILEVKSRTSVVEAPSILEERPMEVDQTAAMSANMASGQLTRVVTKELVHDEIKETVKDTDTNTDDQIAAKSIAVAVEAVVKEMVENAALQADAQGTHQILDSVKISPRRECQPTEQLQDSQPALKHTAEKAETQKVDESGLSVTDQLKNRLNRLKNASANSSSTRSGATAAPAPGGVAAPAVGATEKMQQTQAASETGKGELKENQPPTPARSSRKRRTTGKVEEVHATVAFPSARASALCFIANLPCCTAGGGTI